MPGLNAIVDVLSLRSALAALGRVAPNRFLSHALLSVDEHDSATLSVAVSGARLRVPVPFTRALTPGSVMIPLDRVPSILKLTKGLTVDIQAIDGPIVRLRTCEPRSGLSATYNLATVEVAAEESTGPEFAPDASSWILPSADLQRALERVRHAIGDSSRFNLGGALIELEGSRVALVATDTHRLARQEFRAPLVGSGDTPFGFEEDGSAYRPFLPESAFKTLIGLLKSHGGPDIVMSFAKTGPWHWARFQLGNVDGPELIIQLEDGKFPTWRDAIPDRDVYDSYAQIERVDLDRAVKLVKVATTPDAPGIRIESIGSGSGAFRLSAGESSTDCYVDGLSGSFALTLDASYVLDLLKALGKPVDRLTIRATSTLQENGGPRPAILETDDGFFALVSPISAAETKSAPEADPEPTAEEIQAEEMSSAWPLDLKAGDVALHQGSARRPPVEWLIIRAHESIPGVYWAQRKYTWTLGREMTINPSGAQWTLQVESDDESDPEPIVSDPTPDPLPVKETAKRILTMPSGTADQAADLWYARFLAWMKRRPEGSDHSDSLGDRVRRKLLLGDTFYMANRRYWDAFDASAAESESAARVAPDPEPLSVAPSNPAPLVGNPALQAIIDTPIPRPRRADMRREPRKVWAREVRALLKSLGLSGISVRAPRYSQASSIDITIPGQVAHETSPMRGHDFATCPLCRQEHAAERHIERIIVGAFPDLDDRSDYQEDHFDTPLSIHAGSPIPVASDPAPEPEPLQMAPEALPDPEADPLPDEVYQRALRVLAMSEELASGEPEPRQDPAPESRKARALRRSDSTPRDHPTWPLGPEEGIPGIPPEILSDVVWALGVYRERRADIVRWAAMDADGRYVAEYIASPEPRRRIQSAARTIREFCLMAGMNDLDPFATLRYLANGTTPSHPTPDPEPVAPEPEPIPVASVRGIPITYGHPVPRVAPVPMERTRHGIVLREPEPIGAPENVTVADAGAPAIGLTSSLVSCHGHTEPLSVLDTGAAPSDPLGVLLAIRELADDAPLSDPDTVPETESDPAPQSHSEDNSDGGRTIDRGRQSGRGMVPDSDQQSGGSELARSAALCTHPRAADDERKRLSGSDGMGPRQNGRTAPWLTLAESIDSEADRLEARRTGAGRLMAAALRELAESVRWSGATTPDEHEARMALWAEWAIDNEPQESMASY